MHYVLCVMQKSTPHFIHKSTNKNHHKQNYISCITNNHSIKSLDQSASYVNQLLCGCLLVQCLCYGYVAYVIMFVMNLMTPAHRTQQRLTRDGNWHNSQSMSRLFGSNRYTITKIELNPTFVAWQK